MYSAGNSRIIRSIDLNNTHFSFLRKPMTQRMKLMALITGRKSKKSIPLFHPHGSIPFVVSEIKRLAGTKTNADIQHRFVKVGLLLGFIILV